MEDEEKTRGAILTLSNKQLDYAKQDKSGKKVNHAKPGTKMRKTGRLEQRKEPLLNAIIGRLETQSKLNKEKKGTGMLVRRKGGPSSIRRS